MIYWSAILLSSLLLLAKADNVAEKHLAVNVGKYNSHNSMFPIMWYKTMKSKNLGSTQLQSYLG